MFSGWRTGANALVHLPSKLGNTLGNFWVCFLILLKCLSSVFRAAWPNIPIPCRIIQRALKSTCTWYVGVVGSLCLLIAVMSLHLLNSRHTWSSHSYHLVMYICLGLWKGSPQALQWVKSWQCPQVRDIAKLHGWRWLLPHTRLLIWECSPT
jgi:hypothetical protein